MALLDFLLKRGGGPGAIARRMAENCNILRARDPNGRQVDILTAMYLARAEAGKGQAGRKGSWYRLALATDAASIERFRNTPNLNLGELVKRVVTAEDPNSFDLPDELQMKTHRVIDEVLDIEVPGWRSRTSKPV